MKKLLFLTLFLIGNLAYADVLTPNLGLTKPTTGYLDIHKRYDVKLNENFAIIDSSIATITNGVASSTANITTRLNNLDTSTASLLSTIKSTAALCSTQNDNLNLSTANLTTRLNNLDSSTQTLTTALNSTAALATTMFGNLDTSTANLTTRLNNLDSSTQTLTTAINSTAALCTAQNGNLNTSTANLTTRINNLDSSTATLTDLINAKVSTVGVYNAGTLIGGASFFNFTGSAVTGLTVTAGTATITLTDTSGGGGGGVSYTTVSINLDGGGSDVVITSNVTNSWSQKDMRHSSFTVTGLYAYQGSKSTRTVVYAIGFSSDSINAGASYSCLHVSSLTIPAGATESQMVTISSSVANSILYVTIPTFDNGGTAIKGAAGVGVWGWFKGGVFP